jgi:hypothetical protein
MKRQGRKTLRRFFGFSSEELFATGTDLLQLAFSRTKCYGQDLAALLAENFRAFSTPAEGMSRKTGARSQEPEVRMKKAMHVFLLTPDS